MSPPGVKGMIIKAAFFAFPIFALALVISTSQANASEVGFDLPQPNGCQAVGIRTDVLKDAHRSRDLLVTLWYPALGGTATPAAYMDKKTADALAEDWKLQPDFQRLVRTHARLSPPIAEGGPFPVILLEHGLAVVPAIYTVLAEGLASNGFIVIATNHPSEALLSVFPDGHELKFTQFWPEKADRRTQGIAMGKFVEDVLVADVRFVLDQLQEMNSHDNFWRNRLDLSRVGIVGHSMGGTVAAFATLKEVRILAGINLDGSTFPGMNADVRPVPVRKPFLFLAAEEHASNPAARIREYIGSESNSYYVIVGGADHGSFTDANLLSSRFSRESPPDDSAFQRGLLASLLTRSMVEDFFGKYLKGTAAPHLDVVVQVDKK
jgi:dienelactone hydrolase